MGGVFINYRGEDSQTAAALVDQELTARFGADKVFLDARSIPAGADFIEELLTRLQTCRVMLVIIGSRWLTVTDALGQRRIDDPQDWIRQEIVAALALGIRVIPVLADGATLPAEAELPPDIAPLSRRQYVQLRHRYTAADLDYLVEQITRAAPELAAAATTTRAGRQRSTALAWVSVLAVLAAVAAIVPSVAWLATHAGTFAGDARNTSSSRGVTAPPAGSASDGAAAGPRLIPRSEDGYDACPAPDGADWHAIELDGRPTGDVKTTGGRLTFTVTHAHWRQLDSRTWQVSLGTTMANGTTQDLQHGSWNYDYFVLASRQFELGTGGCFSADPSFVKPGLRGEARAGFVVTCPPQGAMGLVMQSGQEYGQLGDNATITLTGTAQPDDC